MIDDDLSRNPSESSCILVLYLGTPVLVPVQLYIYEILLLVLLLVRVLPVSVVHVQVPEYTPVPVHCIQIPYCTVPYPRIGMMRTNG